jgi:phosphohistidine phosphatase SixA
VDLALLRASLAADEGHLSLEGRQIVRALGNRIRLNEEPSFDRFVTSPSPASVQTAELFADRVDYIGVIEVLPALSGTVPPEVAAKHLLGRGESVVVVGDEPFLSALGAFLVGRPTFPPLVHSQVSIIKDRTPAWCFRPGETGRSQLLVA